MTKPWVDWWLDLPRHRTESGKKKMHLFHLALSGGPRTWEEGPQNQLGGGELPWGWHVKASLDRSLKLLIAWLYALLDRTYTRTVGPRSSSTCLLSLVRNLGSVAAITGPHFLLWMVAPWWGMELLWGLSTDKLFRQWEEHNHSKAGSFKHTWLPTD